MSRRTLLAAAAVACLVSFGARAQDKTIQYHATLNGASEVPPAQSQATGTLEATLDKQTNTLTYTLTYQGLSGPAAAAHFHGPAAPGKNSGVQVALQPPLTSPAHGGAKLNAQQVKELKAGQWYVNVHTKANPAGEIRGQVVQGGP